MNQPDLFGPLASSNARIARETAAMKRDAGMARVQRSAGDMWMDEALLVLKRFLATRMTPTFLVEDIRTFADLTGFKSPKPKAWGPVIKRAEKLGLVTADGYAPANSSNRSAKVQWRPVR